MNDLMDHDFAKIMMLLVTQDKKLQRYSRIK